MYNTLQCKSTEEASALLGELFYTALMENNNVIPHTIYCLSGMLRLTPHYSCNPSSNVTFLFFRGNFDAKISSYEPLGIFVVLGNAFSELCKSWLKDNDRSDRIPCKYWGIAFLCCKFYTIMSIACSIHIFIILQCPCLSKCIQCQPNGYRKKNCGKYIFLM